MPENFMLLDRLVAYSLTLLFCLIAFVYFLRLVEIWLLHRSFREAIQRDSGVAATLVERLETSESRDARQRGDDRTGLLLIAAGLALVGFTLVVGDERWARFGVGSALFPLFAGLVLLGRHIWIRRGAGRGGAGGA
jgi:hypothetical protein